MKESRGGIAGCSKCCIFWPFIFYCFASRDYPKVAMSQFPTTVENNNIKQEWENDFSICLGEGVA